MFTVFCSVLCKNSEPNVFVNYIILTVEYFCMSCRHCKSGH